MAYRDIFKGILPTTISQKDKDLSNLYNKPSIEPPVTPPSSKVVPGSVGFAPTLPSLNLPQYSPSPTVTPPVVPHRPNIPVETEDEFPVIPIGHITNPQQAETGFPEFGEWASPEPPPAPPKVGTPEYKAAVKRSQELWKQQGQEIKGLRDKYKLTKEEYYEIMDGYNPKTDGSKDDFLSLALNIDLPPEEQNYSSQANKTLETIESMVNKSGKNSIRYGVDKEAKKELTNIYGGGIINKLNVLYSIKNTYGEDSDKYKKTKQSIIKWLENKLQPEKAWNEQDLRGLR